VEWQCRLLWQMCKETERVAETRRDERNSAGNAWRPQLARQTMSYHRVMDLQDKEAHVSGVDAASAGSTGKWRNGLNKIVAVMENRSADSLPGATVKMG
jgi:hypothetical protein